MAIIPSKSTKHGFKWKLTSLSTCRVFDHICMLNSLAVRGRRSRLVSSLAFGTTIYEISSFFTKIGNMYIKWKLKTFQIRIWHGKVWFVMKNLQKIGFLWFLPSVLRGFLAAGPVRTALGTKIGQVIPGTSQIFYISLLAQTCSKWIKLV